MNHCKNICNEFEKGDNSRVYAKNGCFCRNCEYYFKKLPVIKECEVIKESKKNIEAYKNEMQEALNLAVKNDTSHIRKLSECA